jgi:hypothetical protein
MQIAKARLLATNAIRWKKGLLIKSTCSTATSAVHEPKSSDSVANQIGWLCYSLLL